MGNGHYLEDVKYTLRPEQKPEDSLKLRYLKLFMYNKNCNFMIPFVF